MLRSRMPQAVALFIALTLLAPAPTHAQFGGLAKKAKQAAERAAEKTIDKKVDKKVDTDDGEESSEARDARMLGEPLTESTITDFLRGLNVELANAQQRNRLSAEETSTKGKADKLLLQHDAEWKSYTNNVSANESCRRSAQQKIDKRQEAVSEEIERKGPSDPKLMAKMMEINRRYQTAKEKAQKSGDKAAMDKAEQDLQTEMFRAMGHDPRADSLALDQQCGPAPREPAWLIEVKALTVRADSVRERLRAFEEANASAGVTAARMTPQRYGQVKERVFLWYRWRKESKVQKSGILEDHWIEIEKYFKDQG